VLPANSDRQNPFGPGLFVSIYGQHLGPAASCTQRPDANRLEPRYDIGDGQHRKVGRAEPGRRHNFGPNIASWLPLGSPPQNISGKE